MTEETKKAWLDLPEPKGLTQVALITINGRQEVAMRQRHPMLPWSRSGSTSTAFRWWQLLSILDCAPTIIDVANLPTGLTEQQAEALRYCSGYLGTWAGQSDALEKLEAAFPEVFADPTGGDPVVDAKDQTFDSAAQLKWRADDGLWSEYRGAKRGLWRTDQLTNVRRLSPETIADLMGGERA